MKDIISVSGMLLKTGLQILQISGRGIKILPPNLRGENISPPVVKSHELMLTNDFTEYSLVSV